MKIEALLICNSNMFVPTVLTEVLKNPDKQYVVISDTANITQFFEFLAIPNIIYHEYGIKGKFDFIREKKRLLYFIAQYEFNRVVFFHAEVGEMANWLIKKLSKHTSICYCKIYDKIPVPPCHSILKILKIKIRQYIYWGMCVDVLEHAYAFPSLPQSFYKKVKAETIRMPIDKALISSCLTDKMKFFSIDGKYVLLTGTVVATGKCTEKDYIYCIDELINTLGKDNILSKCHPRFNQLYGLERELVQIPSFIPGNMLIDSYDYYIGFESTLLVEVALSGKIAISLLDYIPTKDEIRKRHHAFFDSRLEGKGKIYFPKSKEDLLDILNHKG